MYLYMRVRMVAQFVAVMSVPHVAFAACVLAVFLLFLAVFLLLHCGDVVVARLREDTDGGIVAFHGYTVGHMAVGEGAGAFV